MLAGPLFKHNYNATAPVVVNQGGSSSGKTYAILQVLFCLACSAGKLVITVAGQDIPNLKVGALRDAMAICDSWLAVKNMIKGFNRTERVYEFNNGSVIEFKSYDDGQDAKSGKRDYLFVNEANGISWEIYNQLAMRTRIRVFIDYNPNAAFWVHDRLLGRPDVQYIISDHRHNPFLENVVRQRIEGLRITVEEAWRVYARGMTGKVSGMVFHNWQVCNEIPADAKLLACGLDFGFTNDETGCLQVYLQDGQLWLEELFYQTELTNPDIAERLQLAGVNRNTPIIADSAEPKSIEELKRLGWRISGAKKGPDSVKNSIDILKRYRLNVTRQSANLRNELARYRWLTDSSGRTLNQPADTLNHLIDPLRYVALNKLSIAPLNGNRTRLPWQQDVAAAVTLPL